MGFSFLPVPIPGIDKIVESARDFILPEGVSEWINHREDVFNDGVLHGTAQLAGSLGGLAVAPQRIQQAGMEIIGDAIGTDGNVGIDNTDALSPFEGLKITLESTSDGANLVDEWLTQAQEKSGMTVERNGIMDEVVGFAGEVAPLAVGSVATGGAGAVGAAARGTAFAAEGAAAIGDFVSDDEPQQEEPTVSVEKEQSDVEYSVNADGGEPTQSAELYAASPETSTGIMGSPARAEVMQDRLGIDNNSSYDMTGTLKEQKASFANYVNGPNPNSGASPLTDMFNSLGLNLNDLDLNNLFGAEAAPSVSTTTPDTQYQQEDQGLATTPQQPGMGWLG